MKPSSDVTIEELESVLAIAMPQEHIPSILSEFTRLENMGINNAARWAVFLANCAHESAYFTRMEENLSYSARRIMQVWPSRVKKRSTAKRLARNPQALANFVYNGRMGNKAGSNDGWRYRGSGPIQLTGRNNFMRCGNRIGLDIKEDPGLIREVPRYGLLAAADYFVNRRYKGKSLLQHSDEGNFTYICRAINGGEHGLMERTMLSRMFMEIFNVEEGLYKLPLVRLGAKSKHVKILQYYLRKGGYKIYKIDGHFGKGTLAAVKAFQKDCGLTVDGIVGGNTYSTLMLGS